MAEDLRRFLDDEPIQARQASAAERFWRWARRNPAVASLSLLVLLLLAAGMTVSMLLGFDAAKQAAAAKRDQGRAEESARTANEKANEANAARAAAVKARDETQRHLYRALIREAEALRGSRTPGYRNRVWQLLAQAARLDVPELNLQELRQNAMSCLGDFLGREPTLLSEFPAAIQGVALDDTGTELAVLLNNGAVVGSNTVTRERQPPRPRALVSATRPWARFSPARSANGKRTAAASGWNVVVKDAERIGEDKTFPLPAPPFHIALSPDGRWLVSSFLTAAKDGRRTKVAALQVWDLSSGRRSPSRSFRSWASPHRLQSRWPAVRVQLPGRGRDLPGLRL